MTSDKFEKDVRKYPRVNVEYDLSYRPIKAGRDNVYFTKAKTLGIGGLMFESEEPLPVDSFYYLKLVIGGITVETTGKVIYANRLDDGNYQIGIEYTDITDRDRELLLGQYMKEKHNINPD